MNVLHVFHSVLEYCTGVICITLGVQYIRNFCIMRQRYFLPGISSALEIDKVTVLVSDESIYSALIVILLGECHETMPL